MNSVEHSITNPRPPLFGKERRIVGVSLFPPGFPPHPGQIKNLSYMALPGLLAFSGFGFAPGKPKYSSPSLCKREGDRGGEFLFYLTMHFKNYFQDMEPGL